MDRSGAVWNSGVKGQVCSVYRGAVRRGGGSKVHHVGHSAGRHTWSGDRVNW